MSLAASKLRTKKLRRWWKVLLLAFSIIIVLCFAAAVLFISPLTKYLAEKYDLKYTGEPARVKYLQFQKDNAGALMQKKDSVLILP